MAKRPFTWDDYEHGRSSPRQGSMTSGTSRVHFDESPRPSEVRAGEADHLLAPHGDGTDREVRRRRSSMSMRINNLTHVGGVNSIERFARSWQRAVGFHEITPVQGSLVAAEDDDGGIGGRLTDEEQSPIQYRSLLRQQLESQGTSPETVINDDGFMDDDATPLAREHNQVPRSVSTAGHDVFFRASYFGSPLGSNYGGVYDAFSPGEDPDSRRQAVRAFREQQSAQHQEEDKEHEPLLLRRVENEDGKVILSVIGQSTIYQTVLNSTNVLIGVGLLSLPLGIKYAGWVVGLGFLTFSALITAYTAKLLGRCLSTDSSIITFADIAYVSFGSRAQIVIAILFSFELIAACVALFVLFADSLDVLLPGWGVINFKILCAVIMIPVSFVPLRFLGYSSSLGIVCCLGIFALVLIDGFIKPHTPGSLREPATTYAFPQNWATLPLSFGLLMSPWGGHSVFPNIYRDMRHPAKYTKSLQVTFGFTYLLDLSMAVAGLLMFGDGIRDEVTSNILMIDAYPKTTAILMAICIAIIPVTKIPLNARPIFSTIEGFFKLSPLHNSSPQDHSARSNLSRILLRCTVRISIVLLIMALAIVCPSFDRIMALMGSAFCFTICVVLPLAFYLKLFGKEISMREKIFDWFLMILCATMAVVGTAWAFVPRDMIVGAR